MSAEILEWLDSAGVVILGIVAVGVILAGLSRVLKPVWGAMQAIHDFLEDWSGVPARDGVPARAGVLSQLGSLRTDLDKVREDAQSAAFHTKANHGSSSHDALMREVRGLRESLRVHSAYLLGALDTSVMDREQIREALGLPPGPETPEPPDELATCPRDTPSDD